MISNKVHIRVLADVDHQRISELLAPDQQALRKLIRKER